MTIDVIIPAYNASRYIIDTLSSIAGQTLKPSTIIVIDDGSTDDTVKVVNDFYKNNSKVKIICKTQSNSGPSAARNCGLSLVNSKYVAFVDADDIWLPNKLEKQVELFNKNPNLGLVYCDYGLIDEEGRPVVRDSVFKLDPTIRGWVAQKLAKGNFIAGSASAAVIRSDVVNKIGLFDETLLGAEDWDYWLRVAEKYEIDYVYEKLLSIRMHPSSSQNNTTRMLDGEIRFGVKMLARRKYPLSNFVALVIRANIARRNGHKIPQSRLNNMWIRMFTSKLFFYVFIVTFFIYRVCHLMVKELSLPKSRN